MSVAGKHNRSQVIEYIGQALRLNPAQEADRIIAARNAALGRISTLPAFSSAGIEHHREQRQQTLAALERIRTDFWTLPLNELRSELAEISTSDYQDLRDPLKRLEKVAAEREALLGLRNELDFDPIAFESLQRILTFPARETATVREHLRRSLYRPLHLKQRRRMVALLKQNAPGIYELEAAFFDSLLKRRTRIGLPKTVQGDTRGSESQESGNSWVYWLAGIALLQLLRSIFGN